jgi:hypothetical protein
MKAQKTPKLRLPAYPKDHILNEMAKIDRICKLELPCAICGDWKDVNKETNLCSYHANHDLDGNPLKRS